MPHSTYVLTCFTNFLVFFAGVFSCPLKLATLVYDIAAHLGWFITPFFLLIKNFVLNYSERKRKKLKQYEVHYSCSYNSTTLVLKLKKIARVRKVYRRSRGTAPLILNLDAGWSWVVNITPRPFNPPPPRKEPLNRRLDGTVGEVKNVRTVTLTEAVTFLFITNCSSVNQRKIPTDNSTNSKENFQWSNNSGGHVLKLLQVCINKIRQDAALRRYLFTAKLLYMFRASIAPIIRST